MINAAFRLVVQFCFAFPALLLVGCAANSAKEQREYDKKVAVTRAALVSAGDPDSLAAAAIFGGWLDDGLPHGLSLIARAAEAAPDRSDLTWLHAQFCAQQESCDPKPILMHLRSLDPKNGVAWIEPLSRRPDLGTPEQSHARLVAVAKSDRFDVYWNSIVAHTTAAMVRTGTVDTPTALVAALGAAAAQAFPAYQQLTGACRGTPLEDPTVLDECRRVSAVLRRGDTYLSEMVGTAIAKKAWTAADPEYQAALAARRTAHYRMEMAFKVDVGGKWNEQFASQYLKLVASHRTEQEVALAQILEAGLAPDPPDTWKDSRE